MKNNTKQSLQKTVIMAMLVAIAVVSLYIIRTPLLPAAQFLEYDIADVPVLIGTLLFGPVAGLVILVITSAIQAMTVSASSGIIGFIMHVCASGMLVLASGLIYKIIKSRKGMILGLAVGSILMILVMIPLNIVFSGIFMGVGVKTVVSMLIPVFIPFNLIKAVLNSVLTFVLFIPVNAIYSKISKDFK
ncbi:MAG: ECF transporter S component [Clostridia bacterium]|nr:ECF transporter S component [Clostridia bacterium]MBQ7046188.1 ECF transporter S component [Oscillospiraceae bacterium]